MLNIIVDFTVRWQTLIGAALGPLLLGIGFFIRFKFLLSKELKESHRKIEVSLTQSLNDMYALRRVTRSFVNSLKQLASQIKTIRDARTYILHRINLPHFDSVFIDAGLTNLKIKSYYLHNKILFSNAGIRNLNRLSGWIRKDFNFLVEENKFLIGKQEPYTLSETYIENLNNFASEVENVFLLSIKKGIRVLTESKIYNKKLKGNRVKSKFILWKYEGIHFKYFRNKREKTKFHNNIDSLIDEIIRREVDKVIVEAEQRYSKTAPAETG